MNESILSNTVFKQKRAAERLVEESRADDDFYLFLCASVFITTIGLEISSPIVIIGAMLVAPMLYPILALGLAIVTASQHAIRRALIIIGKSAVISIGISLITSFLIDVNRTGLSEQLNLLIEPDLFLFFLISLAAGVVASFSWVTQNTAMSLPGIAITVSLVPPIAAVGISLTLISRPLFVGALMLFVINLLGILLSSVVVFSLFDFQKTRVWQDERIRKEEEAVTKQETETEHQAVEGVENGKDGELVHDSDN
jgi:uncharacterized hydrophobic protein (TIGR00271 family)